MTAIAALAGQPALAREASAEAMVNRSLLARGNAARLRRVFAKAGRGEEITLGFIGGSITQGGIASRPSNNYVSRVLDWWRSRFPRAQITPVNAGLAGTGSLFGAFRVGTELLSRDPDLVIVEFAVNDNWTDTEPFEGLLRQILGHSSAPAVALLFMMWEQGGNCQDMQQKVGAHYDLPMVSFRDAIWPEIQAGRWAWHDLIVDTVHPNDDGHRWAANFCTHLFETTLSATAKAPDAASSDKLPAPLASSRYEHVRWSPTAALDLAACDGWEFTHPHTGERPLLTVTRETATLQINWIGTGLALMLNGPSSPLLSRSRLTIDEQPISPMTRTDFVDRETTVIATDLAHGRHQLRIESTGLTQQQLDSTGLRGVGAFIAPDGT